MNGNEENEMNWQTWVEKCQTLLRGNQLESNGFRYTRPAPKVYEYQWLWDSCFHAMTYRWFDMDMAQDELLSMIARQVKTGADTGMIPHMNYWKPDGEKLWGNPERSIITQPPLIAIAAEKVYQRSQNRRFLEKIYSAVADYHRWFDRRRDPDNDHLVSLIHPWEAGWDASPRWDDPMHLTNPTPQETHDARDEHVKNLMQYDCDAVRLGEAGFYHVEVIDYNAIRSADLEALARIAQILGQDGTEWETKAKAVQTAVMEKMVQPDGIWDLSGLDEKPIRVDSCAKFILLFGGCVSEAIAQQLVADLESPRYWTPYPVPTTPTDSEKFAPDHYWRGNVWLAVNWLIYQGLRRYGYIAQASHIANRSLDLVEKHGFHEYFNPINGTGHGPALQSWSAIVLDMLATEEQRA